MDAEELRRKAEELSCREVVELVTDYLEGALLGDFVRVLEEHLALCEGCAAYLDQMRATILLTGRLAEEAVPPELERALLAAYRDWSGSDRPDPGPQDRKPETPQEQ